APASPAHPRPPPQRGAPRAPPPPPPPLGPPKRPGQAPVQDRQPAVVGTEKISRMRVGMERRERLRREQHIRDQRRNDRPRQPASNARIRRCLGHLAAVYAA